MTIERTTMHLAFSIGLFEQMDDQTLMECFKSEGQTPTVSEIRKHLGALRSEGYEFIPCSCGNYDARGACTGIVK
jgi:hypothetical protein